MKVDLKLFDKSRKSRGRAVVRRPSEDALYIGRRIVKIMHADGLASLSTRHSLLLGLSSVLSAQMMPKSHRYP